MTAITDPKPVTNVPVVQPVESLGGLRRVLRQWPELGTKIIGYHLGQSDELAREGYLHAAVHEATSFLEALIQGMTLAVTGEPKVKFERSVDVRTRLKMCRDTLVRHGYIDADQCQLLVGVFQITRAKGSHPGVTDEPWCRLARRFVRHTAEYLLTRYAKWRNISFKPTATA